MRRSERIAAGAGLGICAAGWQRKPGRRVARGSGAEHAPQMNSRKAALKQVVVDRRELPVEPFDRLRTGSLAVVAMSG